MEKNGKTTPISCERVYVPRNVEKAGLINFMNVLTYGETL